MIMKERVLISMFTDRVNEMGSHAWVTVEGDAMTREFRCTEIITNGVRIWSDNKGIALSYDDMLNTALNSAMMAALDNARTNNGSGTCSAIFYQEDNQSNVSIIVLLLTIGFACLLIMREMGML